MESERIPFHTQLMHMNKIISQTVGYFLAILAGRLVAVSKKLVTWLNRPETAIHPAKVPATDGRTSPPLAADSIITERNKHTLTIFLNRPQVLNAMDMQMAQALLEQVKKAAEDPAIRVVILTGTGRAFCSGGDLTFALQANPEQPGDSFQALTTILHECIEVIRNMPKPVIAALNGPAAGAGLFLALACDIRLMAENAYMKASNTSYGLTLPASGTYTLPRLVGMGKALEIIMLDKPISAQAAQSLGLVTMVLEDKSIYPGAEAFAQELSLKAVHAIGQVKLLMNDTFDRSLKEQLVAEQQAIVYSANHPEGREGLQAFTQKRTPVYESIPFFRE
ncbi:enoyl-CoA hydratase/isomerase family protein [Rhodocytophaga aerolata]|uniref:Enoyl-CoA hydratase/isomerase family protein n=2 Tax=Rhodocytophaga aerolata TaxID=455078 RepID=A0ABT8R805_9BACT|nr:enoyl-CoA hydratase/isomerase family protein [Rhodocytophaga aerolata]MDO1448229.1 enoyl-CoA hydratase/isomerase family protein [Rhodocytophaga aerolata]